MFLKRLLYYLNPLSLFMKDKNDANHKTLVKKSEDGEIMQVDVNNKTQSKSSNINLKMMHGINRISIIMFIIGFIVVIVKLIKK